MSDVTFVLTTMRGNTGRLLSCDLILIMLILGILVVSSGCVSVTGAYIPDAVLTEGWYENTSLRNAAVQFFGLEQLLSVTYEVSGDYPASLTVTTMKSAVLLDEEELKQKTQEAILATLKEGIQLNTSPRATGERYLLNAHKTMYLVFDGVDTTVTPSEEVNVIGEVWNCPSSGTSIFCIGVATLTHTTNQSTTRDTTNWEKIVTDTFGAIDGFKGETGLIDHVICH